MDKLRLHGFNNLTKSLSFNIYDICYARTQAQKKAYIAYLKATRKAEGVADILMPGEIEERERERRRDGIFVEEETWTQILACGDRVGAMLPEPEA